MSEGWRDPVAEHIAAYVLAFPERLDAAELSGPRRILMDTIAVGLGALGHPAAVIARDYLQIFPSDPNGVVVWGTKLRASPDKATLVNGVLLRCYDYNDLMFGRSSGGHPSDMLSALIAIADWRGSDGAQLLSAIALGYEVVAAFYDIISTDDAGWDHATVTALGCTSGVAKLLKLSFEQTCEALAIAAIQHLQSDEIESSIPNRRGDLTMWKRFHGADAMRHAVDACLLASVGAEGAVRPFAGRLGFLSKFNAPENTANRLIQRLSLGQYTDALGRTNMKRWPVGSRAQSAIASALSARQKLPPDAKINSVNVFTQQRVYDHLVAIRDCPWRPVSREGADHSLPYIVGTAVLDGFIYITSFDLDKVLDPTRADFIEERIKVVVSPELGSTNDLSRVEIVTESGALAVGDSRPAPGHRDNPFSERDLEDKLRENASSVFGEAHIKELAQVIWALGSAGSVRTLTGLLAQP